MEQTGDAQLNKFNNKNNSNNNANYNLMNGNTELLINQELLMNSKQQDELYLYYERERRIGIKYFLLFMLNGFLNVIITVIQIIYTSKTQNIIYFVGCFMFGPLHITAVLLAVSISKRSRLLFIFNIF